MIKRVKILKIQKILRMTIDLNKNNNNNKSN